MMPERVLKPRAAKLKHRVVKVKPAPVFIDLSESSPEPESSGKRQKTLDNMSRESSVTTPAGAAKSLADAQTTAPILLPRSKKEIRDLAKRIFNDTGCSQLKYWEKNAQAEIKEQLLAGKTEEEVTKFANRLLEDWRKSTVDDCKVAERCITEDRERICKSRLKITKIEGFLKELESASFDQRETTKIEERDLKVDLHQSRKEHELEKIEKEKAFIKMATRRLTYDTERL